MVTTKNVLLTGDCRKVDFLAVTDVSVSPPLCTCVIYVMSFCPLWGPRRWDRLITQIVLLVGVFP
jgi:hypothetical protein